MPPGAVPAPSPFARFRVFLDVRQGEGLPLLLTQQFVYAGACAVVTRSLRPWLAPAWAQFCLYAVLLANPMSYDAGNLSRLMRQNLYTPLALLVVAGLVQLFARRRDGWRRSMADRIEAQHCIAAWTSLPVGVVTIAERFGGRHVDEDGFESMVDYVSDLLAPFEGEHGFRSRMHNRRVHMLGTSGTVTLLFTECRSATFFSRSLMRDCAS